MADYQLLPSQKLAVMEAAQKAGFPPSEFEWGVHTTMDDGYSVLTHKPSGYRCRFTSGGIIFRPGPESPDGTIVAIKWSEKLQGSTLWLTYLKRETAALDLLTALSKGDALFNQLPAAGQTNTPFGSEEKAQIRDGLKQLQSRIVEELEVAGAAPPEFMADVVNVIQQNFDYLSGALERVGRFDWKNLALTTVITITTTAAFAPDVRQEVFRLLVSAFQQFLAHRGLLP